MNLHAALGSELGILTFMVLLRATVVHDFQVEKFPDAGPLAPVHKLNSRCFGGHRLNLTSLGIAHILSSLDLEYANSCSSAMHL